VSGPTAASAEDPRRATAQRGLAVHRAGRVPYAEALALQGDLVAKRRAGAIPDTLIVLEHPHVITLGSSSDRADVLASEGERARLGIELYEVGRGGGVTYHGPGQLVVYPIVDLKPDRRDLHAYLRDLEQVLIEVAASLRVEARRREGLTGVWTDHGKLAAIGVRVSSHWIASHGVALNVSPDLAYFSSIVPCGLEGEAVTSLERELGERVELDVVAGAFVECFARVFERDVIVA